MIVPHCHCEGRSDEAIPCRLETVGPRLLRCARNDSSVDPSRRPMRRRDLIASLAATAGAWPFAARAQQKAMPVIGFLNPISPPSSHIAAFHQGLGETGYFEGQNVA